MADEITGQLNLSVRNGTFIDRISESFAYDQINIGGGSPGTITAALDPSETTVSFAEFFPGVVIIQNLDTTNNVTFGTSTSVYYGLLKPGELSVFRLKPLVTSFKIKTVSGSAAQVRVLGFST